MFKSIQQAVKPHDKYQIEIKLDYGLQEASKTRYQVETYFFVPQNLGISAATYSKADFYRDIQNYIRLKTPVLILRDFTESPTSPMRVIEEIIKQSNWVNEAEHLEPLITNFKLLSAMLKSSIRDHLNHMQRRIDDATPNSNVHLIINHLVEEFLAETAKISRKYGNLFPIFNLPSVDEQIFTAYMLTDESISILIEEGLIDLFQIIDANLTGSAAKTFKRNLSKRVQQETEHRRTRGYPSLLNSTQENEKYLFRASVLKKYASSILYLSADVQREGRQLEHFAFAIAAGISMVFATMMAFYFQQRFGNFTFSFFIALVIGYMFKDRIKDIARSIFAKQLENILPDRRITIRTSNGKRLGILKEKVRFIPETQVPPRVRQIRNRDQFSELNNDGRGEHVIRHSKKVTLYNDAFKQIYGEIPEITSINDIIRYDIRAYLNKMAEPVQIRHYLEDEQLHPVVCHKVYHLNLVSRYTTSHPQESRIHKRLRLVLNREGIKRIEHIPV